jgi:RNA polymerase sigma factor (sigma-70 family)
MSTVSSAAAAVPAPRGSLSLSRMSDELLARHAARGSERAFVALYQRYHQQLYRYCRSIVRHDADAQDALQSTFTAALSALRRDGRNAPLRPWLYRIAHNEAITLLRRRRRESGKELSGSGPRTASSAEDQAEDRERWSTLVADLATLPERQRGALVMRELSGLSHEEIAIALGTGVGGAKQAIFEARQALSELAEGRAMSCDEVRRRISAGDRRVLRGRRVRAHLHECRGCQAFAAEIPARRAELRAFTPVLPAAAASGVLSRSLHAASAHAGSGAAGSAAATAGAAGSTAATAGAVGKAAGTAVLWKAATGVAVLATTAAGVTGLAHVLQHHSAPVRPAGRTGEHRGVAASANRAAGSPGARHGAAATAAADAGRAAPAGATAGHGHSSSKAGTAAPAPAGPAHGVARHGTTPSHGFAATSAPGHAGTAPHSHSSASAHAPAAHGRATGRGSPSGHSTGHRTRAGTNADARSRPSHSHAGVTVTATTPHKPQVSHPSAADSRLG